MLSNLKTSAVNTKISAIKAKMLKQQDFINIMNLSSVSEVVEYLNEHTMFKDVLWNVDWKNIHRNDIERRLYAYKISIIQKLMNYLGESHKRFLTAYMLRYEIEDLKRVFEKVRGYINSATTQDYFFISCKYSDLDFEDLMQQDSIEKVADKLKRTRYYRLVFPYIQHMDEKFNFYIEMVLDKYYYHELAVSAKHLPGPENKSILEILGINIDLYNLQWIYRAIKYFDMSKEEILNFVLDDGYLYHYGKLKDCIYSLNHDNIAEYFKASRYEFLFNRDNIDLYMERRMNRYMYYKALNLYRSSSLTFAKVFSFMMLIEFEIKDIISILESKRYKMGAQQASKYLIRTIEVE